MKKRWLKDWPWETVVAINAGLCKEKNALHKPTTDGYKPAQKTLGRGAFPRTHLAGSHPDRPALPQAFALLLLQRKHLRRDRPGPSFKTSNCRRPKRTVFAAWWAITSPERSGMANSIWLCVIWNNEKARRLHAGLWFLVIRFQRRDIIKRRTYQSMSATEANSSNDAAT